MTTASLFVDPAIFASPWSGEMLPLGLVDLNNAKTVTGAVFLPPFPLVGVGNPRHPLAATMDVLVESPIKVRTVLDCISAQPLASQVIVQLLRLIEGLDLARAFVAESLAFGLLQGSENHAAWLARRTPEPSKPKGEVRLTRTDGALHILIDRPAARNAIDRQIRDSLREAFELAALDDEIDRVTLRGAGKAFSVGADLAEFGTTRDPAVAHAIRMRTLPAHALALSANKLEVHVQGACVGAALEMAAFATRITASRQAWFQLPELAMGLIPGAGGCVSLLRRIGRQRTALMILSGKRIGALVALDWGLIDAIIDD